MYSKQVREILEKYGWYEGRKVDISKQVAVLEDIGIEVFDKFKEFVSEFDGLKVPSGHETRTYDFHFFETRTVPFPADWSDKKKEAVVKSITEHYKSTEKVLDVGSLYGGYMPLFITESGKLIDDFSIYGNSIEESIENFVMHKPLCAIPERPVDPVKKALWKEFVKERDTYYIGDIHFSENTGKVSWDFESNTYSVDATNCVWDQLYSKKYVLLTFEENETKKRVLYDGKANFVFAYTLDENKIFTSESDFYIVDDLHFVAYDKWQDKLVVLAGDNQLFVYDLNGNMISQVTHSAYLLIKYAIIDYVGYIRVKCQPAMQTDDEDGKSKEITYIIDYDNYTLVKDPLFD